MCFNSNNFAGSAASAEVCALLSAILVVFVINKLHHAQNITLRSPLRDMNRKLMLPLTRTIWLTLLCACTREIFSDFFVQVPKAQVQIQVPITPNQIQPILYHGQWVMSVD